jgi:hypothetical protein
MPEAVLRYAVQALLYGLFAAVIALFSVWPPYRQIGPEQALLRLSFRHPGKPVSDCRERSPEELAKLQPQFRAGLECPRERSPVKVRIEFDGRLLYDESWAPAGLRRDGAASGYRRLPIAAGEHDLKVRVNDDVRSEGPTFEREQRVHVVPGQVVLIDILADRGGVVIR